MYCSVPRICRSSTCRLSMATPKSMIFALAVVVDEDVRRLEIEMDDAEVVDVVERRRDLQDHVVERVPVLPVEELGDPLPGEVLHREVRKAVVQQAVVEDLDRCSRARATPASRTPSGTAGAAAVRSPRDDKILIASSRRPGRRRRGRRTVSGVFFEHRANLIPRRKCDVWHHKLADCHVRGENITHGVEVRGQRIGHAGEDSRRPAVGGRQ